MRGLFSTAPGSPVSWTTARDRISWERMATSDERVDLLVLTVTKREQRAAIKVIEKATCKKMERKTRFAEKSGKTIQIQYVEWDGFFMSKTRPGKIALARVPNMGSEPSFQELVYISQTTLNPFVVTMVGMCAGDGEKVNLGDLLVPYLITKRAGKENADGSFSPSATYKEIDDDMMRLVNAPSDNFPWRSFIPDDLKSIPPLYVHDFILSKVCKRPTWISWITGFFTFILSAVWKQQETTVCTVYEQMKQDKPEWSSVIEIEIVEQLVEEILLEKENYVASKSLTSDFRNRPLERTSEGENYVQKNLGKIRRPEDPVVITAAVNTGDVVSEGLSYKKLSKEVAQRGLSGYEMEGYAFLYSAEENLPKAKHLFVKGVSDFATSQSKMDYYQEYCAASAMAYVCHLFKGQDTFFQSPSTYTVKHASGKYNLRSCCS